MKNKAIGISILAIVAIVLMLPAYGAVITYYDADASNTTSDTDPWYTTGGVAESQNGTWNLRTVTGAGNDDTVIEGMTTTMPQIKTSVTGLADDDYDVWVFFWDSSADVDQQWKIEAGLSPSTISTYSYDGAGDTSGTVAASTLSFDSTVLTSDGNNLTMYGVNLGQVTVSGGSSIDVFVDRTDTTGGYQRTRYDGVGVIPEPASLGLIAIAFAGLFGLRRRFMRKRDK